MRITFLFTIAMLLASGCGEELTNKPSKNISTADALQKYTSVLT